MQQILHTNKNAILKILNTRFKKVDFKVEEDQSMIVIRHNYSNDGSLQRINDEISNVVENYSDKDIIISCI